MTPQTHRTAKEYLQSLLRRREKPIKLTAALKGGAGAIAGVAMVGGLANVTGLPLLLAPFAATSALLFGQPTSRLAQPINVMGGYLIATIACDAAFLLFPHAWLAAAVAVGLAVIVMRWARVTHPPACAMPILGYDTSFHGLELFFTVFVGAAFLVALALVVHRIPPRRRYPL
ncbi:MAG: HPP family protein [Rhizobiaceae bacterium]|jgi:CBS-domain-containing membrane protein|nr:HPP family protein [Rhizobiaceae bacterium]